MQKQVKVEWEMVLPEDQSENGKNTGGWSTHENLLYAIFIIQNKSTMVSKRKRKYILPYLGILGSLTAWLSSSAPEILSSAARIIRNLLRSSWRSKISSTSSKNTMALSLSESRRRNTVPRDSTPALRRPKTNRTLNLKQKLRILRWVLSKNLSSGLAGRYKLRLPMWFHRRRSSGTSPVGSR